MTALYTAVGRLERKKDECGRRYPVVIVNRQEYTVDIPELIIWTCLNWRILELPQIQTLFKLRMSDTGSAENTVCENYVERLVHRGLIVSGTGETDSDALYDLLSNLYVVPAVSTFFVRLVAFFKFTLIDGVPFRRAKAVFKQEKLSADEKRIIALAKQAQLSTAEIIKCVETGIFDLSSEEKIMDALYDDDITTSDNIGSYAVLFNAQQPVLVSVSNLYLRKLIIFERI